MTSPKPIQVVARETKGPLHPVDKTLTITHRYPGDHMPPKSWTYRADDACMLWAAAGDLFGNAVYWLSNDEYDWDWPDPVVVQDFEIQECDPDKEWLLKMAQIEDESGFPGSNR